MQAPHGAYTIEWLKDVLYVELIGSFNQEGMSNYIEAVKQNISKIENSFSLVIDGSEFEGATVESFDVLEQYNEWLNKLNQLKVKVIIQDCKIQEQIAHKYVPALNTQKIVRFTNKKEAMAWLSEQ